MDVDPALWALLDRLMVSLWDAALTGDEWALEMLIRLVEARCTTTATTIEVG